MTLFRGRLALDRTFAELSLKGVGGDGRFSGYASIFDKVDLGRDVIEPGAFARSVATRGAGGVRMLYQHDPNEPIGTWTTIREDHHGLYVEGRLTAGVARADEVLALMKSGALDGLSIGFQTVKAKSDRRGVRHVLEADLWEISVVTFPMQPEARIVNVKRAHFFRDRETELVRVMRCAAKRLAEAKFSKSGKAEGGEASTGQVLKAKAISRRARKKTSVSGPWTSRKSTRERTMR
ncbi:HK97 family phage prohead protease [Ciceribacter sp. L1K23]|uniref:HK97 family phage prohead protease n=1 Tax=Ciceribacter sp. L1K23 TaxID=2820276 RepID=UPI001B81B515|nr:HK97 family phage prohead protease [Ciceribacter sp. L1K23]MBR0556361.1 HK97 family phage prohead protease [Ciceribacter sp. L1K23]